MSIHGQLLALVAALGASQAATQGFVDTTKASDTTPVVTSVGQAAPLLKIDVVTAATKAGRAN